MSIATEGGRESGIHEAELRHRDDTPLVHLRGTYHTPRDQRVWHSSTFGCNLHRSAGHVNRAAIAWVFQ